MLLIPMRENRDRTKTTTLLCGSFSAAVQDFTKTDDYGNLFADGNRDPVVREFW